LNPLVDRFSRAYRATLADVADDVGLSSSTVSRALDPGRSLMVNVETRARIVEAAERLGYRPHLQARSLMTGRTQTIAVIAADLGNTAVTPILHGVASRVAVEGIVPIIAETNDDSSVLAELIDHMLSRRVDAIIMLAARRQDAQVIESAGRIVPMVLALRPLLDVSVPVVTDDDRRGGALVAEHFADLGHTIVGQLLGPSEVMNFPLRGQGFSAVVKRRRLRQLSIRDEAAQPTFDEGSRLMNGLLDTAAELPTAVFAHNDAMAIGAIAAIRERGIRIPEDISVAGYNDVAFAEFLAPSLTTVRYPSWEVGHAAAEVVLRLLAGEEDVQSVSFDPVLIPRGSTGPHQPRAPMS
jgi:LacI family transcriptional regulator